MTEHPLQRWIRWLRYVLAGALALGVVLEVVSNAISVVTPTVARIGTVVALAVWVVGTVVVRYRVVRIVAGATPVVVTRLGPSMHFGMIGVIALLWLPQAVELIRAPPAPTPLPAVSTTAADAVIADVKDLLGKSHLPDDGLARLISTSLRTYLLESHDDSERQKVITFVGQIGVASLDLHGLRLNALDFRKLSFKAANFAHVGFVGADFRGADLEKANFTHADIRGANFSDATLPESILDDVTAHYSRFRSSILLGAHFDRADFTQADLEGAKLANAIGEHAIMPNARLVTAECQSAHLAEASLEGAELQGANFDGADMRMVNMLGATIGGDCHPDGGPTILGILYRRTGESEQREAPVGPGSSGNEDVHAIDMNAHFVGARLDEAIWPDGTRCRIPSMGRCESESTAASKPDQPRLTIKTGNRQP